MGIIRAVLAFRRCPRQENWSTLSESLSRPPLRDSSRDEQASRLGTELGTENCFDSVLRQGIIIGQACSGHDVIRKTRK